MNIAQTRLAELETLKDDLKVIRLKENIKIDNPGIRELMQVTGGLGKERLSVLVVIPEDTDFDVSVMQCDHGGGDRLKLLAFVSSSSMFHDLVGMYLRYFPVDFPVMVFDRSEDALLWLEQHPEHRVSFGTN